MKSTTHPDFWTALAGLPLKIREQARFAYALFRENPNHPSLHFKRLQTKSPLYSARVGRHHRALALKDGDTLIWFWIGDHDAYLRTIAGF